MSDRWDDARIERVLATLADHLDVGDGELATSRSPRRALLVAAAALVAVAAGVTLVVAPVRETVAGWLSIGSTRVETATTEPGATAPGAPSLAELPVVADGAVPIGTAEARARGVDVSALAPTPLGPPDQMADMPEGGVLVGWAEGATTLWIRPIDPLTGSGTVVPLLKQVAGGDDVHEVVDLGDAALLITGDHVLQTPLRRLAAGTVLLWIDGSAELRLESDLSADAMVAQARAVDVAALVPPSR